MRRIVVIAVLVACAGANAAESSPTFEQLVAPMVGHWVCSSQTNGKVTTYTSDYAVVGSSKWIRGINRTASTTSEDMETYDPATKQWKILDMEPDGSSSVLVGTATQVGHVATRSVYPDTSQYVRYDSVSNDLYTLTFDFLIEGKHVRWVDTCKRA